MHRTLIHGGKVGSITIRRLSDFHAHFRQDVLMRAVTKSLIRLPRYILAMPNTGPITTIEKMLAYHAELRQIADAVADHKVDFIMTIYLTELTTPAMIERMAKLGIPCAVKYYPPHQGATTGSGHGVPLDRCHETLVAMTECGIPLLGHFEKVVNDDGTEIDPKDREGRMVDDFLWGFRDKYPLLKKSFEHASTAKAVDWTVADDSGKSFMTVTPQHSLFIATDLEVLGVDLDCMPCEKTAYDRAVIRRFMTSGDARVGAGTDEAPHIRSAKLAGAKGCWTPNAAEMYADVFDAYDALDERFEAFMSINAPVWWGLPLPDADDTVTFVREQTAPPEPIEVPELHDIIVPLGWSEKGPLFTTKFKTL